MSTESGRDPDNRPAADEPSWPPRWVGDLWGPFRRAHDDRRAGLLVVALATLGLTAVFLAIALLDAEDFRGDPTGLGIVAGLVALGAGFWVARTFAVDRESRTVGHSPGYGRRIPRRAAVAPGFAEDESLPVAPLVMTGVDLRGARLDRAPLAATVLDGARLERAQLRGADLRGASLVRARLDEASLAGADLTGADLTGARLTNTDLRRATLVDAILVDCDLDGADVSGADVTGADFSGAATGGALGRPHGERVKGG